MDDVLSRKVVQGLAGSPLLVALYDRDDMLQWANAAFREAYGLEPAQQLSWSALMRMNHQQQVGSRIETEDIDTWIASARSRRGKQPTRAFEADLHGGRWLWMTETVQDDGWMLCVGTEISSLRSHERDLRQERDIAQRAALTDPLTAISNRAHVMALIKAQLERVQTGEGSCGIALFDLDFFKQVNDCYGHHAGDRVLQHFAGMVCTAVRREDGVGRLGGEEFMAVLPDIDAHTLQVRMERLLQALSCERPLPEHPDFAYSCSVGMTFLMPGDNLQCAYQRADTALYAAKQQGRNRVAWAEPLPQIATGLLA